MGARRERYRRETVVEGLAARPGRSAARTSTERGTWHRFARMLGTRSPQLVVIGVLSAGCVACAFDSRVASDEPPKVDARWQGEEVHFSWTWPGEVDAFNAVVTTNGIRGLQTELPGTARSVRADGRGSTLVSLALQACDKGLVKSSCTAWTDAVARR